MKLCLHHESIALVTTLNYTYRTKVVKLMSVDIANDKCPLKRNVANVHMQCRSQPFGHGVSQGRCVPWNLHYLYHNAIKSLA